MPVGSSAAPSPAGYDPTRFGTSRPPPERHLPSLTTGTNALLFAHRGKRRATTSRPCSLKNPAQGRRQFPFERLEGKGGCSPPPCRGSLPTHSSLIASTHTMIHDYLENPRLRTVVQDKPHPGANANYNSLDSRARARTRSPRSARRRGPSRKVVIKRGDKQRKPLALCTLDLRPAKSGSQRASPSGGHATHAKGRAILRPVDSSLALSLARF